MYVSLFVQCLSGTISINLCIFVQVHTNYNAYIRENIHLREVYDKFPDFFRMGTFIDSTHMKL